jgi:hypothetical protein
MSIFYFSVFFKVGVESSCLLIAIKRNIEFTHNYIIHDGLVTSYFIYYPYVQNNSRIIQNSSQNLVSTSEREREI